MRGMHKKRRAAGSTPAAAWAAVAAFRGAARRHDRLVSLMRIFDTSIPGDDEYDGRNALGCRDLFCEKYFEVNPGKNVIYATYYGTPDICRI